MPDTPESALASTLTGSVLGFDFGERRIGVALGNTLLKQAQPLHTINSEKNEQRFALIADLIQQWQPVALVVGLPCNDDGSPHQLTALCRRFANRLAGRYALPTFLIDERYTSLAASEALTQRGVFGQKQKPLLDQYAAQQILQAWFDEPAAAELAGRRSESH